MTITMPHFVLSCLGIAITGLALTMMVTSAFVSNDDQLEAPPREFDGTCEARTGLSLVLMGIPFIAITCVMLFFGVASRGLTVLPIAALVMAGWGGGRVWIASGGTPRPALWLLWCSALLLGVSAAATPLAVSLATPQ